MTDYDIIIYCQDCGKEIDRFDLWETQKEGWNPNKNITDRINEKIDQHNIESHISG
jgi:hypothetical protein